MRSIKKLLESSKHHDASAEYVTFKLISPKLSEVIKAVEQETGISRELFLPHRPKCCSDYDHVKEARRIFLWAAVKACSGRLSLGEIGTQAGEITAAAVSTARRRVDKEKLSCPELEESCRAILARMDLDDSIIINERLTRLYNRLAEYKSKFGHCLVPKNHPPDPQLGRWVAAQRTIFAKANTTDDPIIQDRIAKLDELGFSWQKGDPHWNEMFETLKAFKLLFGHCNVPENWEPNPELSAWVAKQRNAYKRQALTADQKMQFEELGF